MTCCSFSLNRGPDLNANVFEGEAKGEETVFLCVLELKQEVHYS